MKDGKPNQRAGKCRDCGGWVPAHQGVLRRHVNDDGSHGWTVVHRDACPDPDAPTAGVPTWAVPAEGRTPEGSSAHGFTLVTGSTTHPEAVPVDQAAQAIRRREERESEGPDPEQAKLERDGTHRRWRAFQVLEGYTPRPEGVTDDELAEALDGADIEAMRRQVEQGRREILERLGVAPDAWNETAVVHAKTLPYDPTVSVETGEPWTAERVPGEDDDLEEAVT